MHAPAHFLVIIFVFGPARGDMRQSCAGAGTPTGIDGQTDGRFIYSREHARASYLFILERTSVPLPLSLVLPAMHAPAYSTGRPSSYRA